MHDFISSRGKSWSHMGPMHFVTLVSCLNMCHPLVSGKTIQQRLGVIILSINLLSIQIYPIYLLDNKIVDGLDSPI
jgi:hypothetical protein